MRGDKIVTRLEVENYVMQKRGNVYFIYNKAGEVIATASCRLGNRWDFVNMFGLRIGCASKSRWIPLELERMVEKNILKFTKAEQIQQMIVHHRERVNNLDASIEKLQEERLRALQAIGDYERGEV